MLDPRDDGLLQDLLDGRLTTAEAEEVRARIAADPGLAAAWAEMRRLRELLRAEGEPLPSDFLDRVREAIARPAGDPAWNGEAASPPAHAASSRPAAGVPRPRWVRVLPLAYAAAAVLVVGLTTTALLTSRPEAAPREETSEQARSRKAAPATEAQPGLVPDALEEVRAEDKQTEATADAPGRRGRPKPESSGVSGGLPPGERLAPAATVPQTLYLLRAPTLDAGRAEVALLVAAVQAADPREGTLRDLARAGDPSADARSAGLEEVPPAAAPRDAEKDRADGPEAAESLLLAGRILALPDGPPPGTWEDGAAASVLAIEVDLTPAEAERLAAFVALLAPTPEPQPAEAGDRFEAEEAPVGRPGPDAPAARPQGGAGGGAAGKASGAAHPTGEGAPPGEAKSPPVARPAPPAPAAGVPGTGPRSPAGAPPAEPAGPEVGEPTPAAQPTGTPSSPQPSPAAKEASAPPTPVVRVRFLVRREP